MCSSNNSQGGCVQNCTNVSTPGPGNSSCECNPGYMPDGDSFLCNGKLITTPVLILIVDFAQTSMSVPVTMVVVLKFVPTLLVATHVDVTLDMSWMEMDHLAMVKGV